MKPRYVTYAARSSPASLSRLEHENIAPSLHELSRGKSACNAAAHDDNVGMIGKFVCRAVAQQLRRWVMVPVGMCTLGRRQLCLALLKFNLRHDERQAW